MTTTTVNDSPYSGTIYVNDAYTGGLKKSLCSELFEVPNRHKSKVSIIVKASSGAQILLYDENADEKWAVKITLGVDKSSNSTIGLNTRDAEQESAYPTQTFHTPSILNGTHFKAFILEWNYGVIKLYNDGGAKKDALLSWKGPSDMRIGHFGVKTLGSFGDWRVQGSPEFNTTSTNDIGAPYQHFKVNSGRIEFEVRADKDAYVILSKQANDDDPDKIIHLVLGGTAWIASRNAIYESLGEVANYSDDEIFVNFEYRCFWVEWDAYNIRFGVKGTTRPKMVYKSDKPISQLSYFGFITIQGQKAYFRILEDEEANDPRPTISSY